MLVVHQLQDPIVRKRERGVSEWVSECVSVWVMSVSFTQYFDMTVWWLDQCLSAYTLPKCCGRSLLHTHVTRGCSCPLLPGVTVLQHLPSVVALLQAGEREKWWKVLVVTVVLFSHLLSLACSLALFSWPNSFSVFLCSSSSWSCSEWAREIQS